MRLILYYHEQNRATLKNNISFVKVRLSLDVGILVHLYSYQDKDLLRLSMNMLFI
jgi:hypothetical protein